MNYVRKGSSRLLQRAETKKPGSVKHCVNNGRDYQLPREIERKRKREKEREKEKTRMSNGFIESVPFLSMRLLTMMMFHASDDVAFMNDPICSNFFSYWDMI